MRFRLFLLAFLFIFAAGITSPPSIYAQEISGWCWCTGADDAGNTCARTTPPSGAVCAGEPANNASTGGFDVCCSDPGLYGSHFALKSAVCGSAQEIVPSCVSNVPMTDGGSASFCIGNEFRLGETDPAFNGVDQAEVVIPERFDSEGKPIPAFYNGFPITPGRYYVCNSISSCCSNPSVVPGSCNHPVPNAAAPGGPPATVPLCSDMFPGGVPDPNTCYYDGNLSRPGGSCKERVPYVHDNLDQYTLSCVTPPEVSLNFETCKEDEYSEVVVDYDTAGRFKTGCADLSCYIDMRLLVNFSSLQSGSLGPSSYTPNSPDTNARTYPYSGLADKPLFVDENTQKEAFRTWWRLQPLTNQLNAKAAFLVRADQRANSLPEKFKRWLGDLTNIPIFKKSAFPYNPKLSTEGEDSSYHQALADYMNAIIDGSSGAAFLRLLSPVFNITSSETQGIIDGMIDAGANFAGLDGFAANTYTLSGRRAMDWYGDYFNQYLDRFSKQVFFTEFGDFATFGVPLSNRGPSHEIILEMTNEFIRAAATPQVATAIYFNAMGNHPGFRGHELRPDEYQVITASAPTKSGINSASNINGSPGGFPQQICDFYPGDGCPPGGFTLEIAFSESDVSSTIQAIKNAHERGMIPIVRICAGDTCDFADPQKYNNFLLAVDAGVNNIWYAIAGPNEPEGEHWVTGEEAPISYETDEFKLEDLLNKIPNCLKNYPVCAEAANLYHNLDQETKSMYDALQPFNFDNVRGYLGLAYVDPTTGNRTAGVLAENLPYAQAMRDILADPAGGILTSISPDWLNRLRYPSALTNNNFTVTYPPEGPLPFPDSADGEKNNAETVIGKAIDAWSQDDLCRVVDRQETKLSLASPLTYPKKVPIQGDYDQLPGSEYPDALDQAVLAPVTVQILEPDDANNNCVPESSTAAKPRKYIASLRADEGRDPALPVRASYGRTITVLTNPKFTDFSRLISGVLTNTNNPLYGPNPETPTLSQALKTTDTGLFPLLLPQSLIDEQLPDDQDQAIFGQSATYNSQHEPNFSSHRATAGNSGSGTAGVPRKAGVAQILLCQLRNYWLRPLGLQLGTPSTCEEATNVAAIAPLTTTPTPTPTTTCQEDLRIQLIGDSITYYYAPYLPAALEEKGITNYTIVGTQGYPGLPPTQIANLIRAELDDTQPTLALIHAGTNNLCDVLESNIQVNAVADIINQVQAAGATPLLTTIIPRSAFGCDAQAWPIMNNRLRDLGSSVEMANLLQTNNTDYNPENNSSRPGGLNPAYIHPSPSGYTKIARAWADAVAATCQ